MAISFQNESMSTITSGQDILDYNGQQIWRIE